MIKRSISDIKASIRGSTFQGIAAGPLYYWVFNYTVVNLPSATGAPVPFYNGSRPCEFVRVIASPSNPYAVAIGSSQVDTLGNNTLDIMQPGDTLVIESEVESGGGLELFDAGQFYASSFKAGTAAASLFVTIASRDQRGNVQQ